MAGFRSAEACRIDSGFGRRAMGSASCEASLALAGLPFFTVLHYLDFPPVFTPTRSNREMFRTNLLIINKIF